MGILIDVFKKVHSTAHSRKVTRYIAFLGLLAYEVPFENCGESATTRIEGQRVKLTQVRRELTGGISVTGWGHRLSHRFLSIYERKACFDISMIVCALLIPSPYLSVRLNLTVTLPGRHSLLLYDI